MKDVHAWARLVRVPTVMMAGEDDINRCCRCLRPHAGGAAQGARLMRIVAGGVWRD